jgi:ferritin
MEDMISKTVEAKMNDQIQHELYAAYLYLAISAWFESINLPGAAHWMASQAQEEMTHALRFYNHVQERGGRVELQAIDKPPVEFDSTLDAFKAALAHEQKVTAQINDIFAVAEQEKDYASRTLLQWFIDEQVEEEKSVGDVVLQLEMIGDHKSGLFMLDRELGQRPMLFTLPTAADE